MCSLTSKQLWHFFLGAFACILVHIVSVLNMLCEKNMQWQHESCCQHHFAAAVLPPSSTWSSSQAEAVIYVANLEGPTLEVLGRFSVTDSC